MVIDIDSVGLAYGGETIIYEYTESDTICRNTQILSLNAAYPIIPFDTFLSTKCENSYALAPMIAFQSTFSSDNKTVFLDRVRRLFGGFPFVQRCNELFQHYKIPVLCLHLLVLFVAILLVIQ